MKATLRVKSCYSAGRHERPRRKDLEAAAELLAQCGFSVLRTGRYGVTVEGDEETFLRELGARLGQKAVLEIEPPNRELARYLDLLEVQEWPDVF